MRVGRMLVVAALLGAGCGGGGAEARTADDETPYDPWGGHTLEWATTSPPPPGNFLEPVGPIESERPLLDARAAAEAGDAGDTNGGEG